MTLVTWPTLSKCHQIIMVFTSGLEQRPFNSVLLQNIPEFTLHPHITRYVFLLPAILLTEEAFLAGR